MSSNMQTSIILSQITLPVPCSSRGTIIGYIETFISMSSNMQYSVILLQITLSAPCSIRSTIIDYIEILHSILSNMQSSVIRVLLQKILPAPCSSKGWFWQGSQWPESSPTPTRRACGCACVCKGHGNTCLPQLQGHTETWKNQLGTTTDNLG